MNKIANPVATPNQPVTPSASWADGVNNYISGVKQRATAAMDTPEFRENIRNPYINQTKIQPEFDKLKNTYPGVYNFMGLGDKLRKYGPQIADSFNNDKTINWGRLGGHLFNGAKSVAKAHPIATGIGLGIPALMLGSSLFGGGSRQQPAQNININLSGGESVRPSYSLPKNDSFR